MIQRRLRRRAKLHQRFQVDGAFAALLEGGSGGRGARCLERWGYEGRQGKDGLEVTRSPMGWI